MGQHSYVKWPSIVGLGIGMVMFGFGFLVVPSLLWKPHWHHGTQIKSSTNIRSIAQGLVVYSGNHNKQFPDHAQWQEVLIQKGVCYDEQFVSPDEDGDGVSYILVSSSMTFDPAEIMLYEDPKHHEEGVLVAFSDAHTEYVPFEEFERMLAEQLAAQAVDP